jgi:hypothetical protein
MNACRETFRYSSFLKGFMIYGVILFSGGVVMSVVLLWFGRGEPGCIEAGLICGPFFLVVDIWCLVAFRQTYEKIHVDDEAITHEDAEGWPTVLPWSEIESVRERPWLKRWDVRGHHGITIIRIDCSLSEFERLLDIVEERTKGDLRIEKERGFLSGNWWPTVSRRRRGR